MILPSLRLGARKIVRYPAMSLITFLTLTIGIAVSATIFAVTWSTLVHPFPFADQERLLLVWAYDAKGQVPKLELTYDEAEQIAKESKTIESIAPYSAANFPFILKRGTEPMQFSVNAVGHAFFTTLGVQPMLGRSFNAAEHKPGGPTPAILSYDAWRSRFGSDPRIVGKLLYGTDGSTIVPIIGVMPKHFDLPIGAEMIFSLDWNAGSEDFRLNRTNGAIAKMRPGITIDQAARELAIIGAHARAAHPEQHEDVKLTPYSLVDEILGTTRQSLRIIFAMGMLVLIIALFNTASVAFAQGVGRTSELGIRGAVGATRWSSAFRFFIEASVIALSAAIAGFVLARALLAALLRIAPVDLPRISEVRIGSETVIFALCAALGAATVTALTQAFRATNGEVLTALRASAKSTSHRGVRRLLEGIAAGQTAVAIVTLVVAALLVQSFRKYASIDTGFSTDRIITFHLQRGYSMGQDPPKNRAFFKEIHERIRNISGVEASGSTLMRPLEIEQGWDMEYTIEGQAVEQQEHNPLASLLSATPQYLGAMRIPLLYGRDFAESDTDTAPRVAIIGESFARRYWNEPQRALGKRLKPGKTDSPRPWITITGIARDVRSRGLTTEKLDIYVPYTQTNWSPNYFAVRTTASPETILPAIRQIVAQMDKDLPVSNVKTTAQIVDAKLMQPRLSASIVTLFAGTATLLALIGFYGMLAYVVRERTAEIGVRIALGAHSPELLGMIVKRAMAVALIGVLAGVALSIAAERLWRGYVFGIDSIDPTLIFAVALVFELMAVVASLIPAVRAASIDAATALRAE